MTEDKFHYHPILGYWSVTLDELPDNEAEVAVEREDCWDYQVGVNWPKKRPSTKFYAYVLKRRQLPEMIGQGKTRSAAVNHLLKQFEKYFMEHSPMGHQTVRQDQDVEY